MKNTFVKVLSFVMALMMVVGTFGTLAVFAADCTHENKTLVDEVEASCKTIGYTEYECKDCGERVFENVSPKLDEHDWKEVPESKATCDEPAYSAHLQCKVCEVTKDREVIAPANGHKFLKDYEFKATCYEDGFTSKECVICGKIDDGANKVITKEAAHDFAYEIITEPTSCTNGSYKATCTVCNFSKLITDGAERDHANVVEMEWWGTVELKDVEYRVGAGCNAQFKKLVYCAACEEIISSEANEDFGHMDWHYVPATGGENEDGIPVLGFADVNEKLAAFGFEMGDAIYQVPTCDVPGWDLAYCEACGEYFKKEWTREHLWAEEIVGGEFACVTTKKVYTCKYWNCEATKEDIIRPATEAHKFDEDMSVAPTCTANGYKQAMCSVCGELTERTVVYATGHKYGDWKFVEDKYCFSGANNMFRECENENCPGAPFAETHKTYEKTACEYETKTTAATCMDNAYNEEICKTCGHNNGRSETQPAAGKNAANHVIKDMVLNYADSDVDKFLQTTQVATCTKEGRANYACACGEMVNVKNAEPLAHKDANGDSTIVEGVLFDNDTTKTTDDVDAREVASTCKTLGWNAGKVCTQCGYLDTPRTRKTELDPANHEKPDTAVEVGSLVVATCSSKPYYNFYYECCGIVPMYVVGSTVNPANHSNATLVKKVEATCKTTGMEAYYYCADCKKYMEVAGDTYNAATAVDTLADLDLVIDKLSGDTGDHSWGSEIAAVKEQCQIDGRKAYKECYYCDAILIGSDIVFDDPATTDKNEQTEALKVAAHGNKYLANVYYKNGTHNCTTGAYENIPNAFICSECGENNTNGKSFHDDYWVAPSHIGTIEYIDSTSTATDCTMPTYGVQTCTACGDMWVGYYNSANVKDNHQYKNDKGEYVHEIRTVNPTCIEKGYTVYKCVNCEETIKDNWKDTIAHFAYVGGVKLTISFDCVDYDTFKGYTCAAGCGKTVTKDDKILNHTGLVDKKQDATCTEDGFIIKKCEDCKVFQGTNYEFLERTNHKDATLVKTENGVLTYFCDDCGVTFTKKLAVVDTAVVADSTVVAAGTEVDVTVKVSAAALTFGQLHFVVDAPAFEVVGVKFVGSFEDASVQADLTKDGFAVYTLNTMAGEPVFVTLDGEDVALVTLTLKAKKSATLGAATVKATATVAVTGYNEKNEEIREDLVNNGEAFELTIARLGDVNGDGKIGFTDLQAVASMAVYAEVSNTRNSIADVNGDGAIDDLDVTDLRNFIKNGLTAAAYLDMTNQDLDAALNALNYNELADAINFEEAVEALFEIGYDVDFDKVFDKDNTKFDGKTILEALDEAGSLEKLVAQLYTIWAA